MVGDCRTGPGAAHTTMAALRSTAARPAPVAAFANAKGGVGKSTLAFLCAVFLASRRTRVCFIDLDPQQSGKACVARFVDQEFISIPQHEPAIRAEREADDYNPLRSYFGAGSEIIIVDTPAGLPPNALRFLGADDLLVVPTSGSDIDLVATRNFTQGVVAATQSEADRAGAGDDPVPATRRAPRILLAPNRIRGAREVDRIRRHIPEFPALHPVYGTPAIERALHTAPGEAEILETLRRNREHFEQFDKWARRLILARGSVPGS